MWCAVTLRHPHRTIVTRRAGRTVCGCPELVLARGHNDERNTTSGLAKTPQTGFRSTAVAQLGCNFFHITPNFILQPCCFPVDAAWAEAREGKHQLRGVLVFNITCCLYLQLRKKFLFCSLLLGDCRVLYQKKSLEDKMQRSAGGKFNTWDASSYLRENLRSRVYRNKRTS